MPPSISSLPDYVPRDGRQSYITPIKGEAGILRTFLLPVKNPQALRDLCNRYLNFPWVPYEFRPITSFVAMTFGTLEREYPVPPSPDDTIGYLVELNVAFWVPVIAGKREGPFWIPHHLAFYLPYLYVNNSIVLTSGRGTYGFPKQIGFFVRDTDPTNTGDDVDQDPKFNRMDTYALSPQAPGSRLTRHTLLRVLPPPDLPPDAEQHPTPVEDLVSLFTRPGHELEEKALALVEKFTPSTITWVFLKQFRDAVAPEKCCYQAVLEADSTIDHTTNVHLLHGPFTLELTTLDSVKPAFELGLVPPEYPFTLGETLKMPIELALYSQFDFVLHNAELGRVWPCPVTMASIE